MQTDKVQTGKLISSIKIGGHMDSDLNFAQFILKSLSKHRKGDFGNLCDEDRETNEIAVLHQGRVLSCYHIPEHIKVTNSYGVLEKEIWIITEIDRQHTTILYPHEY